MRILLTGASGFAGSLLIGRLLAEGHTVRALARDPARVALPQGIHSAGAGSFEVVRGDVLSGEGLKGALGDIEVAYYLIHSMESVARRPPAADRGGELGSFAERERRGAERFASAARLAGVRRIVYLGGLLPASGASRHLASRAAVEQILMAEVPGSVALRASIVIGARSRSFRLLVRLVERMPLLALPAWRRFRTAPIDARDVTELLLAAASVPQAAGRSLDIGGPDVLTYGEVIQRIAELMLVARPTLGLPVSFTALTARVAAAIAGEDPQLIVALMEGLASDLLPGDHHSAQLLGVQLHSFDAAVEHALGEWESAERLAAR